MTTWNALDAIQRAQESKVGGEQRIAPRFTCSNDVTCGGGRVLNVSQTGVRVWTKKRPPQATGEVGLLIESPTGKAHVGAEFVWCRKSAAKGYEIGLRLTGSGSCKPGDLFKMVWDPSSGEFITKKR